MIFPTNCGVHVLGGIIVQYLMSILLNIRQIYARLRFFFGLCVILLLPIYYNDKKMRGKIYVLSCHSCDFLYIKECDSCGLMKS